MESQLFEIVANRGALTRPPSPSHSMALWSWVTIAVKKNANRIAGRPSPKRSTRTLFGRQASRDSVCTILPRLLEKKCLKNAISYFTSDLREKYLLANWVMVSFVWRNSSGQYGALTPALSDTFGMNWNANCKPNRLILYQYHQTSKCSFGWMSKNSYATYTRPVLPSE